eukprot:CAMPEP_0177671642 /NCGR_PEP_ID=MMETSP0447-20121125/24836_1 /TAXON_ID=0 /ORGANISM="Stygamoeba regulata, Strain BSH-02190019" /LENGTH=420 /DNA_ID=CAMNT_0019179095 /DNA_START=33 /DNA_END=1292 /DNA_ORIENTATION=-
MNRLLREMGRCLSKMELNDYEQAEEEYRKSTTDEEKLVLLEHNRLLREEIRKLRKQLREAQAALEARDKTIVSLKETQNVFRFTLQSMSDQGLLSFWTGFTNVEEFRQAVVKPVNDLVASLPGRKKPKSVVSMEDRAFWIVAMLRKDLSYADVHRLRGLRASSKSTTRELLHASAKLVHQALSPNVRWPRDIQEWQAWTEGSKDFPKCADCVNRAVFVIDGSFVKTRTPKRRQLSRLHWKDYKKTHAWGLFVLVAPNGRIVYCSKLFFGHCSDENMYKRAKIPELLTEVFGGMDFQGKKPALAADKGYPTIELPHGWGLLITRSGEKMLRKALRAKMAGGASTSVNLEEEFGQSPVADMSVEQLQRLLSSVDVTFSDDLAPMRAVVERSIGAMKMYKKLTAGSIRTTDNYEGPNTFTQIA